MTFKPKFDLADEGQGKKVILFWIRIKLSSKGKEIFGTRTKC